MYGAGRSASAHDRSLGFFDKQVWTGRFPSIVFSRAQASLYFSGKAYNTTFGFPGSSGCPVDPKSLSFIPTLDRGKLSDVHLVRSFVGGKAGFFEHVSSVNVVGLRSVGVTFPFGSSIEDISSGTKGQVCTAFSLGHMCCASFQDLTKKSNLSGSLAVPRVGGTVYTDCRDNNKSCPRIENPMSNAMCSATCHVDQCWECGHCPYVHQCGLCGGGHSSLQCGTLASNLYGSSSTLHELHVQFTPEKIPNYILDQIEKFDWKNTPGSDKYVPASRAVIQQTWDASLEYVKTREAFVECSWGLFEQRCVAVLNFRNKFQGKLPAELESFADMDLVKKFQEWYQNKIESKTMHALPDLPMDLSTDLVDPLSRWTEFANENGFDLLKVYPFSPFDLVRFSFVNLFLKF
jgi:hypothetical protein